MAVATFWFCSSRLGKAGVYLQISLLQMQGRQSKLKEESIPVGNLTPGLSWLLGSYGTDSVRGGGPAARTPNPFLPICKMEGAVKHPP